MVRPYKCAATGDHQGRPYVYAAAGTMYGGKYTHHAVVPLR
jgi:hypothetical protein